MCVVHGALMRACGPIVPGTFCCTRKPFTEHISVFKKTKKQRLISQNNLLENSIGVWH